MQLKYAFHIPLHEKFNKVLFHAERFQFQLILADFTFSIRKSVLFGAISISLTQDFCWKYCQEENTF